jgi:hypothetical protein
VRQIGGAISIESSVGRTIVTATIPLAPQEAESVRSDTQ